MGWDFGIWEPRSRIQKKLITDPDPGVKEHRIPDPVHDFFNICVKIHTYLIGDYWKPE
jgi:hypothetical protein